MIDRTKLPRGPSGRIWPTLQIIRNPRSTFETWVKRYGDPFFVHALNGPIVVTGRPDLIKQIYGTDPELLEPFAAETLIPMFGSGSMLLIRGEAHRRERKLITPMFHGDRMRAYGRLIEQVAREQLAYRATGQLIGMQPITTEVSFQVIVRAIFGGQSPEMIDKLMSVGQGLVKSLNPLLLFSPKTHFKLAGLSPWDRFQRALANLDAALDEEIERRQTSRHLGEDILSLLVEAKYEDGTSMTRAHIRDELRTFLFAGHETSAIALAWAVYLVHQHPEVLKRLQAEIDAAETAAGGNCEPAVLAGQPYLKAVVQETLRIYPIVTEVLRLLKRPESHPTNQPIMQLDQFELQAGMAVAPAAILVHYRPDLYPEPDRFRPERFLERTFTPYEYMPFGGGHRRCIGAAFATFEIAIVLATWLREFRFELCEPRPVVPKRRSLTLGPSTPVMVKVTQRYKGK